MFVFVNIYIISAHKNWLPALFEKYSGNITRKYSNQYYATYYQKSFVKKNKDVTRARYSSWRDYLDFITGEPRYTYCRDISQSYQNIPEIDFSKYKSDIIKLVSHPGLNGYLWKDNKKYKDIYLYEFLQYAENFENLKLIDIKDPNFKTLWKNGNNGNTGKNSDVNREEYLNKKGFQIFVKKDKNIVGVLSGNWNRIDNFYNEYLEKLNLNVSALIVNQNKEIIYSNKQDPELDILIDSEKRYKGKFAGVVGEFRVISFPQNGNIVLLLYKASSFLFYFLKALMICIVGGFFFIIAFYINKKYKNLFHFIEFDKMDQLLSRSVRLQQDSLELVDKYYQRVIQTREKEVENYQLISKYLALLGEKRLKKSEALENNNYI